MGRVLMLASVASMIDQFNLPNIRLLLDMGHEVHVACNFEKGSTCTAEKIQELKGKLEGMGVPYFQVDFERDVRKVQVNRKAYSQVLGLCRRHRYAFLHCHSPIGGVVGRLAGHKTGTGVIYTAHGFHFFRGAPVWNWLLYYPAEKWLSRYTDVLVTINREDYERAKRKFHAGRVEYIPGVGVDVERFAGAEADRAGKRRELGLAEDAFVLLSVGELNRNKNHGVIIRALAELKDETGEPAEYVIAGKGALAEELERLAEELGVGSQVHLIGFRSDVEALYKMADAFCFPSLREGLGMGAVEALSSGLPLITSDIHGIRDYSVDGVTGYRCGRTDVHGFAQAIQRVRREGAGKYREGNMEAAGRFDQRKVLEKTRKVYEEVYHLLRN